MTVTFIADGCRAFLRLLANNMQVTFVFISKTNFSLSFKQQLLTVGFYVATTESNSI